MRVNFQYAMNVWKKSYSTLFAISSIRDMMQSETIICMYKVTFTKGGSKFKTVC